MNYADASSYLGSSSTLTTLTREIVSISHLMVPAGVHLILIFDLFDDLAPAARYLSYSLAIANLFFRPERMTVSLSGLILPAVNRCFFVEYVNI